MTAVDEVSALTQSIGEHAVQAIGRKHLSALSVVVNPIDMTARIAVSLRDSNAKEQARAFEKFFDVQDLFFDDVSMTLVLGVDGNDLPSAVPVGSQQFSFA
ncbi:hypothetical protein AB0N73_04030 [Microbacterium sp. NPDC089189]|uniref:hypothetical protein n=1 Tax=Microbacterium sp. NPDC089189 TaxID=3154972 RepID=UPI00342AA7AD